jgi:hypothetical protein
MNKIDQTQAVGGGGGGDEDTAGVSEQIGGLSVLKGLILYGATLTFAGLYGYFIAKILGAHQGKPPTLDATEVTVAAALAGVLGSAFALEIGAPTAKGSINHGLRKALQDSKNPPKKNTRALAQVRLLLSLAPGDTQSASWPKTFGIWVYAVVASAVALTYTVNQSETPDKIKVLAVAFAGYVLALINAAYDTTSKESTPKAL